MSVFFRDYDTGVQRDHNFMCRNNEIDNVISREQNDTRFFKLSIISQKHALREAVTCGSRQKITLDCCLYFYRCSCCYRDPSGLDTGDLILFDRPCLKMGGFFGAAICAAAKLMSGSPFDHIGVVVRERERELGRCCR